MSVCRDGIYGVDCPIGQEEACKVVGKRQSQSCTICGLAAPERNLCTPAMDDGAGNPNACGVTATNATDGTVSIVPALTACRMNMAPVFVRVKGVVPWPSGSTSQRYIIENPGQELYDASLGQDEYQYPVFRAYRGDVVLFALTAVDRDDCTELSVEATALPEGAVLEPPEYLSEYDEFPEGQMVRRVFRWNGPRLAVTPDERPPASMVCFYATDKYLLTSQPFYCIEILIEEKPSSMEQTLMRFDCKLSLNWNQLLRRFVIIDAPFSGPVQKYYTKCEFEDFMWHHAMVSVQENGDGTLYIDGEAQELVTNVGKNPQELTQFGRGTDVGVTVSLSAYPNQCEPGRRRLMPDDGGPDADVTTADVAGGNQDPLFGKFKENALTDENVDDGFIYDVDPTLNGTGLSCCSFTVASGCSAQTILRLGGAESHSFAGLSDEIAIWNRALSQDEIRETMFKMPQYLPTHKLEAPRGVQLDLAAGRVLYTRFNNPCMEGLAEGTPTAARKLLQLPEDYVYTTGLGSSVWIGGLQFDESRREGISDDAGFTAGTYVDAEGYLKVTSSDNVTATFIGWREHAGYAYTGVPWAAPIVHAVQPEGPVPLDGGVEVVVKGVGFARSPFLKCATIQPDVRGEYVMPSEYEPRATYDGYVNRFLNVDGSFLTHSNPWMYDSFSQVQLTRGKTKFMPDDAAPELHPSSYRDQRNKIYNPFCPDKPCAGKRVPRVNCKDPRNCPELNPLDPQVESRCTTCTVGTRIDWLATNTITHKGQLYPYERISPLPGNLGENYAIEYYYGGWETVTCQAPPGPFPSDMYYIGVSNDAGITGSPPTAITYTEYALRMSNSGRVLTPEVPGKSFSAWFLIEEEAPPCISGSNQTCRTTIFRLTNGVGVSMDYGVVVAKAGMRTLGDMSDEQFIGSLGSNLTTLGEWHHAMLTINGTTIKFYLDGVDVIEETIQGDAPAQGYKLLSFGDGLIGFIDEVKVFKEVLTYDEYLEAMWRREPAETDRMSAYYRLNSWDHPLMDSIGGHDAVCSDGGVCTLRSVASPWEPTTLYSVNGDRKALETGTVSGGEVIDIVGFNFAPSQWLGCAWGVFTQDDGFLLPELEEDGPACPPLPAPEKLHRPDVEGKMGRPDGRRPAVKPYGLMRLSGEPDLFVREAGLVSLSNSLTMRCVTPQLNRSGVYQFAPVSREALVTTTYEFVEVAYECDGLSDYIEVAQAAQMLTNSSAFHIQGYTISMWVLPYSKVGDGQLPMYDHGLDQQFYRPHVPGAPGMMGPVRQALLDPTNYIGVIAAFENPTPTAGPGQRTTFGSLVYNGEEFYYYDDCIADVKSTAPAVSAEPNQWHFIAVAVDADGEGTLYVDGNAADHFTTNCSVPMDSLFSLCASLYENPAADGNLTRFTTSKMPNSHFAGRIDEVELHRGALGWATLESAMFKYDSAGNPEVKYNFSVGCNHISKDCSDVGTLIPNTAPGAMMGDAAPFGGRLVKSTAPWAGAQVLSASLSEASVVGNEPLTIRGHNFAPSQWLKLNLGYGPQEFNYSTPNTMEASTPEGVCHDDLPVSVTNADGIPEKDGSSVWNLEYECTTEGLLTNLVAFYNMDGQQSQVEDLVSVLRDSVGNAHGACPTEYMQADRDGYLRSAFGSLSGNARACAVPAPAMLVGVDDFSVAAWVFLPYFAGADASMTALGGWKLVTYTVENGLATVYAGHQPALQQDREYLLMVMGNFTATGSLSMGLWDDIWVYDRVLRPCEVAGRYFTSSYALDLTKSEEESINGGTKYATVLPWGYGSVAAWVYAYDVHDSQSIVASQNGTFVLGVEQGRVSLAIAPGPGSKCICEPCEKQINYVSWKSRIMPSTWHHVAVSYNGFDAYILVDGVLRDKAIVRERCFDKPKTGGRRRTLLQEKSPGPAAMNEFTRKLQGVRGYGLHPECTVNGSDPDLPTCVHSSPNAQDAIEPQCLPWMLEPDAFMLGREANVDFDHPYLGPDNHMRPFNGLIYDLRSFDSGAEPFEVKALSQCIPKDPLVGGRGDAYIKLNDGVSSKVLAYTVNGKALAVEGVSAGLYRNVSVDDPTHPHATTMFGPGVVGTVNGEPGLLTITARTYCGEKRAIGGDKFKLTLATEGFPLSDGFVEIYDSNDGTYAVSYGGLPSCNIWNATLSMVADGLETEIDRFPIDIIPAATDPTKTEAFIGPADAWTQCANSLNSFLIQARDFHNCPQRDLPDGTSQDVFVVSLRGPADLEAHITYEGDGVHRASFVPPVSGTYFVEVSLQTPEGPAVIANGQQCITVCNDGSMLFTGQGYVEVTEPPTSDGFHYLDGAGLTGFTMEAWVRRFGPSTSGKEAYILIKGTFEEAYSSAFVKGYSMSFSADNRLLQASVYTSLGVLRTVTAPNEVANEVWFHVAAVYNGTTFSLYRNGAQVATEYFDSPRALHHNPYYHPVTVGPGFYGGIDEVKITSRAKSRTEILESFFCPPPMDMQDVILYLSFNSDYASGTLTQGYSEACKPHSREALARTCLQAEIKQHNVANVTEINSASWTSQSPMVQDGAGFISRQLSYVMDFNEQPTTDVHPTLLTVAARDRCGFAFVNGTDVSFCAPLPTS